MKLKWSLLGSYIVPFLQKIAHVASPDNVGTAGLKNLTIAEHHLTIWTLPRSNWQN